MSDAREPEMGDVREIVGRIGKEAEQAMAEVRWVRTCRPGDEIRQGDVYLYPIAPEPDHGPELETRQLAPGRTRGSRHIVDGTGRLLERVSEDALDGPFLHAAKRVTITHPEHAHVSLPAGWYEVRYQRDFSVRGVRRVWD